MERKLEFKDKFEQLTLEELNATCKIKNADGKHIVEPQKVFTDVIDLIKQNEIVYDLRPIIAKGGQHALYNTDLIPYVGENNIKAYTLLRTSGIITFPALQDDETTMQIRIDVSERGITMATGKLVLVCTNGMTAFKEDLLSTYGSSKIQYEQALGLVENWIHKMPETNKKYNELIVGLKNTKVNKDAVNNMLGKLLYQAVDANRPGNNFISPLNVSQVSAFTNAYIEKDDDSEINNGWDLYNLGTNLLKHDNMDMTIIAERNFAFTNFMLKDFGLNVSDARIVSEF